MEGDAMSERRPTKKHFTLESKTKQSFKQECDINTILGNYRTQGFTNHINLNRPVYGDFAGEADYLEAMTSIIRANEVFDALPARIRARVENDPAKLIAFVADPDNEAELRELGLVNAITENPEGTILDPPTPGEEGKPPGPIPITNSPNAPENKPKTV